MCSSLLQIRIFVTSGRGNLLNMYHQGLIFDAPNIYIFTGIYQEYEARTFDHHEVKTHVINQNNLFFLLTLLHDVLGGANILTVSMFMLVYRCGLL